MGKIKKLDIELPPPRAVHLDERTEAYIEKIRQKKDFEALDIKLDDFEGPLDLLLFLVEHEKINIEDIFVSRITDQYLTLLSQIDALAIEKMSEFIEIAAILIEIKSQALLPKPEVILPDENDVKRDLVRRLEEYRIYKEAGEKMKSTETIGVYYKEPDPSVSDPVLVLRDMTMDGLLAAMRKLFLRMETRAEAAPPRKITLDRFTVAEKMGHIRDIMLLHDEMNFFELFESDYSKSEIITTFQAVLELLKLQDISAEQTETYGDILIKKKQGSDGLPQS